MSKNRLQVIAGEHCGKKIWAVSDIAAVYASLEKAAASNHWARLVVKELNSLSVGAINKNNIKVRPRSQRSLVARGVQELFMDLPCLQATILHGPDGSYLVTSLVPNAEYFNTSTASGLYAATKRGYEWNVKKLSDGCIVPDNGDVDRDRIVSISDGNYQAPEKAAMKMATLAAESPNGGGSIDKFTNYDIHYTGAGRKFGSFGLVSMKEALNPPTDPVIRASAQKLAYTMYQAKDIGGINWVSIHGGSVVLTEAMRILANKGVTLDKHTIFLREPKSSPTKALDLSHKLKMIQVREFSKNSWWNHTSTRGRLGLVRARWKEKNYTFGHALSDTLSVQNSVAGAIIGAGIAVGVTVASGSPVIAAYLAVSAAVSKPLAKTGHQMLSGAVEAVVPSFWSRTKRWWS